MYRTLSIFTLTAALWLGSGALAQSPLSTTLPDPKQPLPKKQSALDKGVLEAWARHLFVMDSSITVRISDPKPAQIPGFVEETLHASKGERSQDFVFYISNDGSKI